jgi:hypothetical protein
MLPLPIRHGTLYVFWSARSSRVPFIELMRVPGLSELDIGWLRISAKLIGGQKVGTKLIIRPRSKPQMCERLQSFPTTPKIPGIEQA